MKIYGQLEKVQLENLASSLTTAEPSGRIYWQTTTKKVEVVDSGVSVKTLVDSVALTNSLPTITGTRAAPSSIVAGTGISFTGLAGHNLWFVAGSGGAVDISANPQIVAGSAVGQELILIGRDATNTVQLDDGTGLSLNGSAILGLDDVVGLIWDGTNWVEMFRRA